MIGIIGNLIDNGHAYANDGHVLFDVPSWPDYGKFSGRDRDEQRPDRFQVGNKVDAMVTGFDRSKKPNFSIKARQIAEEKEAVAQFGSSDSGASLGDILGEALKKKED